MKKKVPNSRNDVLKINLKHKFNWQAMNVQKLSFNFVKLFTKLKLLHSKPKILKLAEASVVSISNKCECNNEWRQAHISAWTMRGMCLGHLNVQLIQNIRKKTYTYFREKSQWGLLTVRGFYPLFQCFIIAFRWGLCVNT